jgi:phage terminase small subunit
MPKLTDKQRLFVAEYPKDLNATRAAIRAGYSKRSAYNQGQRMMKNDDAISPVVNVNVDARGATQETAASIGDEVSRGVSTALREVLKGGRQYGVGVAQNG